ncbi:MAG: DUF5675 family protein, partial [Cytophagaceae bacterium]|nr:DUF5675 family protein [Cytophagaceae bacterium]
KNEEWDTIKKKREEHENLKALGMEIEGPPVEVPKENPYKDETFGLPPGTVRATIAMTILMGGVSLLIIGFDPAFFAQLSNAGEMGQVAFEKYLEFFKTAFLMMIAFYFGSQSLKYIRPSSEEKNSESDSTDTPEVSKVVSSPPVLPKKVEPEIITGNDSIKDDSPLVVKSSQRISSQKKLNDEDIKKCAEELGIEPALIYTVLTVESLGGGFLKDGRPKILFEGHVFWKNLKKRGIDPVQYQEKNTDIVYPKWTKQFYSKSGADEYKRLERARAIHKDSANAAASWGLFQILGENYAAAGFDSIDDFVKAQEKSELNQLSSFVQFIKSQQLIQYLQRYDWRGFASRYNGPGYEANQYHIKLEEAYAFHRQKLNPTIKVLLQRGASNEKETLGTISVMNAEREVFTCKTLELPWKDNKVDISCIPKGTYKVQKRYSARYLHHFHVMDVPGRNWILIHTGNYYSQIAGSIIVGLHHVDLNKDGVLDVSNSAETIKKLQSILPDQFMLTIS